MSQEDRPKVQNYVRVPRKKSRPDCKASIDRSRDLPLVRSASPFLLLLSPASPTLQNFSSTFPQAKSPRRKRRARSTRFCRTPPHKRRQVTEWGGREVGFLLCFSCGEGGSWGGFLRFPSSLYVAWWGCAHQRLGAPGTRLIRGFDAPQPQPERQLPSSPARSEVNIDRNWLSGSEASCGSHTSCTLAGRVCSLVLSICRVCVFVDFTFFHTSVGVRPFYTPRCTKWPGQS